MNSVFEQNLDGKWLLKEIYTENGKRGYPGFQMLEIKDSSVIFYSDFSLTKKALNLRLTENEILNSENEKFADFKYIDRDQIKLYVNGKSNDSNVIFQCLYFRLVPTVTKLKKNEIEKLTFWTIENGRETEINFNQELWEKENLKLLKVKKGMSKMIEKIDSTFFITTYFQGKRNGSIPIKKVTKDSLILHMIPTPFEIKAYRKD